MKVPDSCFCFLVWRFYALKGLRRTGVEFLFRCLEKVIRLSWLCHSFSVLVVQSLVAAVSLVGGMVVDRVGWPARLEQYRLALVAVSSGIHVSRLVDSCSTSQGCRKRAWVGSCGFCASNWRDLAVLSHLAAECQRLMFGCCGDFPESPAGLLDEW